MKYQSGSNDAETPVGR